MLIPLVRASVTRTLIRLDLSLPRNSTSPDSRGGVSPRSNNASPIALIFASRRHNALCFELVLTEMARFPLHVGLLLPTEIPLPVPRKSFCSPQ